MFRKQNPPGKKTDLSQFGLLDVDDISNVGMDDLDEDDPDLEAELAAISGGGGRPKPRPKPTGVPNVNLDAMIAESLKDIPSDDEGSGDDDDPDLLNELQELTYEGSESGPVPPPRVSRPAPAPPGAPNSLVSLLQERISNYTLAEKNAKANGESGRARRFARGLKTLNDLMKQAKAGKAINEEDIPPIISVGKQESTDQPLTPQVPAQSDTPTSPPEEPSPPPATPSPPPKSPSPEQVPVTPSEDVDPEKQKGLQLILRRKEEFKAATIAAKKTNKTMALEFLKIVKQFDLVLEAYKKGEKMDLDELPTPQSVAAMLNAAGGKEDEQVQTASEPAAPSSADGLVTASSVEEALKQRLAVFQEQEERAKEAGNASKQRRMGRIVKQYKDALRAHAAGRPVPVDELPTPPGFAPIPGPGAAKPVPSPSHVETPEPDPDPAPAPAPPPRTNSTVARADKQVAMLLQKQREYKMAALAAKKNGDITAAVDNLRKSKQLDKVIEAARAGRPLNLDSLKLPPTANQTDNSFEVVTREECAPEEDEDCDDADVLTRMHQQLGAQLRLCQETRDHYHAMGNVAETGRFESLAAAVKQDLVVVNMARKAGQSPPKFHYQSRKFTIVQCNTDLNENDLELTIVRGIAYNVTNPKDVDTYVKFEFPYPQETPVSDRTGLVKDTNNPEYNATFPLTIARSNRACLRVFKRHGIKFEVYSRGGWFSRDTLLGTAVAKLHPLEAQTTLHEAFPLMEGRRQAGGSIEVRLRLRTPLLQQQFESKTHRWLVLDN